MKKTAVLLVFLAGCGADDYDDRLAKLNRFASEQKIGQSADHWLEKNNAFGEWEPVALVFAYLDDYSACMDLVRGHKTQFPADEYRCTPANR